MAEYPNNDSTIYDRSVLGAFELLALMFALPFGEDLYHGTSWADVPFWHWLYLAIGIVFAAAGPLWPKIRTNMVSERLSVAIGRTAAQPRTWLAILLIFFVYGIGPEAYRRTNVPIVPPTPPAQLSLEEREFRRELHKFVFSDIDDAVETAQRVLYALISTAHGSGAPNEPLSIFARDAFDLTLMAEWGKLQQKMAAESDRQDISGSLLEIRNFMGVYQRAQQYIALYARGAGLDVLSSQATDEWLAADSRSRVALKDLEASPFADDLKHIDWGQFASNNPQWKRRP